MPCSTWPMAGSAAAGAWPTPRAPARSPTARASRVALRLCAAGSPYGSVPPGRLTALCRRVALRLRAAGSPYGSVPPGRLTAPCRRVALRLCAVDQRSVVVDSDVRVGGEAGISGVERVIVRLGHGRVAGLE